jgi:hypothetical protein
MRKLYILLAVILAFLFSEVHAQLSTGDLAFVYFNKEEDGFALVNFADIPANSTIYIKDDKRSATAFNTTNSAFTWNTGASVIPAGTITMFTLAGPTSSNGTVSTTVGGVGNEPLWAFIGTDANTPVTFLAAIGNGTDEITAFGSLSGTGLNIGSTAVLLTTGIDRAKYTGIRSGQTAVGYLSVINDMTGNWQQTFQPPAPSAFSGIIDTSPSFTFGSVDVTSPTVTFTPANNSIDIATTSAITLTFSEDIREANNFALDNANVDNVVELRLSNASGALVDYDATISGRVITITPSSTLSQNQVYYVALKANTIEDGSDNATDLQSATFTTILPQTQFQSGDLVFVGYQMNAIPNVDRLAILTFVDILPGTLVNFTDAKYTDNPQPQCSGGFTWRAPSSGVASGTVITIQNDAQTTDIGTLSGSGFGLGAGGDQVIVYTGTASAPNYITALSSNEWVSSNASCSGGNSKLPLGLTDGQSSINLSTLLDSPSAPSTNTPNAYYTGTHTGTISQLRTSILNSANWVGMKSGDPAQTWPTWTFPGPPSVTSATIISQTTIKIIFNKTLNNSTATNIANYTGIAGLQTATLLNDKEVTLTYGSPFTIGGSYSLSVSGIMDTEARTMVGTYPFNFTYNTGLSFDKKFVSVKEEDGLLTIKLKLSNPSASSIDLVVKSAPFSNATSADFTLAAQTLNFTGSSVTTIEINIPIINDAQEEQDEYFVLSLENASGVSVTGGQYMTVFIKDNDRVAPQGTKSIELSHVTSYSPPQEGTAEIVVHDPASQRLFIISSIQKRLDIADFSNPSSITHISSIDMTPYGGITSVATKNGIVAVASPNADPMLNGSVVFFNTNGEFLEKQVTVGVLPDMITFSPDGKKILTANEGQPNDAYTVDPEGSVSVIDISGGVVSIDQSKVTTIGFGSFNAQETALITSGVRKLKLTSTLSQDFEPEYITVSADSKKAWVTLQENNAIAELDLDTHTVTSIWAMGKKDFNVFGNGFDASDNNGVIVNANWPVKAFYIPDAIASYSAGAMQYLVTANEGDEKEYSGLNERTTVGAVALDPAIFPNAAVLKETHNLGRLRMTNLSGDTDGDGDYDEISVVGSRSFTIWDASTKAKVFDSGDDFERITAADPVYGAIFNGDNEGNGFKNRSRAKGPEPEGVALATFNNKTYAFIALERVGGVMVYDITDPAGVKFVDYKNNRSTSAFTGDHGPEGISFISRENSPNGKRYIVVANEISGSVSVYEVIGKDDQEITFNEISDKTDGGAPFELAATASSDLIVSFSTEDDEVSLASSQVTIIKPGRVTIVAGQTGNYFFNAATPVEQSFCINPAKPSITLSGENTGDEVLTSSASSGNQWFRDAEPIEGATASTYSIDAQGVYSVKVTIEDCESEFSDDLAIIVTGLPGQRGEHITISPNPAFGYVNIDLPGNGQKEIVIYNSLGTVQQTLYSEKELEQINIQGHANGYYLVKVRTTRRVYVGKFIKK